MSFFRIAGSGNTYEVKTRGILTGDIVVQYAPESWRSFAGRAFIGIADVRTQTEYGVARTFTGFDTSTNTGITAGVGVTAPITSFLGALSVTGELRYVGLTNNINIPGAVGTRRDSLIGTLGLEYDFTAK